MINYQTISRMRSLPRKMGTLERRVERDREELQRIRNDLLHETQHVNVLRRRERTLTGRIERNMETVNRLRLENMELRQKMQEVFA